MAVKGSQYRNQSQLHEWLTKLTLQFLYNMATQRGVIWRQEHTIHNGMRPDAVGFCDLQDRFKRNLKERQFDFMFVFETKVSYADYKNSFNGKGEWKEKPYSHFHFLVVPKGFSETYDLSNLPDYWGILEPDRTALHIKKSAKFVNLDRLFFLESAYTILFKWGRSLNLIERELLMKSNELDYHNNIYISQPTT